jgi:hypothetical protein
VSSAGCTYQGSYMSVSGPGYMSKKRSLSDAGLSEATAEAHIFAPLQCAQHALCLTIMAMLPIHNMAQPEDHGTALQHSDPPHHTAWPLATAHGTLSSGAWRHQ